MFQEFAKKPCIENKNSLKGEYESILSIIKCKSITKSDWNVFQISNIP